MPATAAPDPRALRAQLAATGAVAMLAQVALLRECGVAFFGGELALVLGLAVWLLGSGLGALTVRAAAPAERAVRRTLLAAGVLVPLELVLARGARGLLGGVPGAELPLARQPLVLLLVLLPAAGVLGRMFALAAKRALAGGASPAAAYAIECAGALSGGLAATLLAAAGRPNAEVAFAAAALALLGAAWPWRRAGAGRWPAAALLVALAALAPALPRLDRALTAWAHPDLVATRDTPYARVSVTSRGGQLVVYEDDALAYESEGTAAEELVAPAAVQRERPLRSAIVLGGAAQGLLPEVLRHAPEHVLDLELDRALVTLVAPRLDAAGRAALADPRVTISYGDPRRTLARAGSCDLLLVGMPEPTSGRTSRFYTREFFAECARHLGADGVLALRLRGAENLLTPLLVRRAAGIERSLAGVFASVVVLPGTTTLFLASRTPLPRTPELPCAVLAARVRAPRLVSPAYLRWLYTNDRFAAFAGALAAEHAAPNSDLRPACYAASLLLGLARFEPRLAHAAPAPPERRGLARSPWLWAGTLAALGLLALARRRDGIRRAAFVALAGAAGTALESALLLHYQIRCGVLQGDLGLLLAAFMAGLALGAPLAARLARRDTPLVAVGVALALAVLGGVLAALLHAGALGGRAGTALALVPTGALVAAAFACAAGHEPRAGAVRIGPLWAADLAGGCAGALAAGLVLVPLVGLDATALAAASAAILMTIVAPHR